MNHLQHINSDAELKQELQRFKARATQLCGRWTDGRPLSAVVADAFDKLIADETKPEERAAFLLACEKDREMRKQLCSIRVEQASNYILANTNIIPFFFNIVNLGNEERAVFQNNTEQEIRVGYVGEDGINNTVKIVKPQAEEMIPLKWLATEEVRYRKWDIYRGNVVDAALQTIRLSYDMANKMDKEAFTLLTKSLATGGAYGNFTTTGNKATRVYLANSRINTALLPLTNDIDATQSPYSLTKFSYKIFKIIIEYAQKWGNAFQDGPLVPTGRILVPGAEAADLADEITPAGATNNFQNSVAEQLLTQGWVQVSYLGRTWTLVSDNTLTSGTCYVEFNKKPGIILLKPGMDMERVSEGYTDDAKNEESRYMKKVFGGYINSTWRPRTLRIKYK